MNIEIADDVNEKLLEDIRKLEQIIINQNKMIIELQQQLYDTQNQTREEREI